MLALGALGAVEVASRLAGQRGQVVAGRADGRSPAAWPSPLTALGYGAIGLAPGGDRRDDLVRPRPGGQDLPPARLPVGPAGHQDGHPPDPRRGQGRLGHRPAPRRPQETPEDLIRIAASIAGPMTRTRSLIIGRRGRAGPARRPGVRDHRDRARPRGAVRTYTELFTVANRQDLEPSRAARRGAALCTERYLQTHSSAVAARARGSSASRATSTRTSRPGGEGPNVWICPTNRVGPVYQFVLEDGAWRFDGPVGILRPWGEIVPMADLARDRSRTGLDAAQGILRIYALLSDAATASCEPSGLQASP